MNKQIQLSKRRLLLLLRLQKFKYQNQRLLNKKLIICLFSLRFLLEACQSPHLQPKHLSQPHLLTSTANRHQNDKNKKPKLWRPKNWQMPRPYNNLIKLINSKSNNTLAVAIWFTNCFRFWYITEARITAIITLLSSLLKMESGIASTTTMSLNWTLNKCSKRCSVEREEPMHMDSTIG